MNNKMFEAQGLQIKVVRKSNLKNIFIRVNPPDGSITINAPTELPDVAIEAYFIKRLPEVVKAKEKMLEQVRQEHGKFVTGEIHFLWGKPYRLQVVHEKARPKIIMEEDKLIMVVHDNASWEARETLLLNWYRQELKQRLKTVAASCEKKTGIKTKVINVRNMKTRWGTCNAAARSICINLQLAKKSVECLKYVVIHEMVHIQEEKHTDKFYALMEKYYPDWKKARQLLSYMPLSGMEHRRGNDPEVERYL